VDEKYLNIAYQWLQVLLAPSRYIIASNGNTFPFAWFESQGDRLRYSKEQWGVDIHFWVDTENVYVELDQVG
jgi:hypothetical protein